LSGNIYDKLEVLLKVNLSIFFLAVVFLFAGCFMDDIADITVKNSSDFDVSNIKISYFDIYSQRERFIEVLPPGEIKTFTVLIQKNAVMTFTSSVDFEYYINDTKFDIFNLEDVDYDYLGEPYSYKSFIGGGNDILFTIENDSYSIKNIRR
jgi:hypothetical protein